MVPSETSSQIAVCGSEGAAGPPPPFSSTQAYRGGKRRRGRLKALGRASRQGCWLVLLPTPGQPLSASSQCSTVSWLLKQIPGRLLGTGISTTSPREGVSQCRRGLRGLSRDGSSYPCPAGSARATGGRSDCSLAGGREGGGESGLHPREEKEGKLNVRAKDQDDRWH